jgi:hypothetical protein
MDSLCRKISSMRHSHPLPVNQRVAGSSPADGAIFSRGYAGIAAASVSQIPGCLTAGLRDFHARHLTPQPWPDRSRPPPKPNLHTTLYSILVAVLLLEGMIGMSVAARLARAWAGEGLPWG